ncbi:hypothetical protein WJX72_009876 [[Myrmecia] bisecta]|uniref:Thioredoxin domain-containing protein n=1 Tax=[Myrmecia] bisecta TaxID=41462 RepID=A0AAW1P3V3_9CHLO
MSTQFKRSLQVVEEAEAAVAEHQTARGRTDSEWYQAVGKTVAVLAEVEDGIAKMKIKAQEKDPAKQLFGKSMSEKVLALAARFDKVHSAAQELHAKVKPLGEAALAAERDAAAKAQREVEERRQSEAEALRKVEQEQAAAAKKLQLAEEEEKRKVTEARLRREAARKAALDEKLRAAEAGRKEKADAEAAKRAEAEAARKQALEDKKVDDAKKKQEAIDKARATIEAHKAKQEAARQPAAPSAAPTPAPAVPAAPAAPPATPAAANSARLAAEPATPAVRAPDSAAAAAAATPAATPAAASTSQAAALAAALVALAPAATTPAPATPSAASSGGGGAGGGGGGYLLPPGQVIKLTMGGSELRSILQAAQQTNQLAVVDFSASWCGPCRMMAPVLERLAVDYTGRVVFVAIDAEATAQNRQLTAEAAVRGFPTFQLYQAMARVAEFSGARPEAAFRATIEQHLPPQAAGTVSEAVAAAVRDLQQHIAPAEFLTAVRLLATFAGNVVQNPDDLRYRRVRKDNERFRAALGSKQGGIECVKALGFFEIVEAGQEVMVMQTVPSDLAQVKANLDAIAAAGAVPAGPAAPPATPATPHLEMSTTGTGQAVATPAAPARNPDSNPGAAGPAQRGLLPGSGAAVGAQLLAASQAGSDPQPAAVVALAARLAAMLSGAQPATPTAPPAAAPAAGAAPAAPAVPASPAGQQRELSEEELIQMAIEQSLRDEEEASKGA